MHRMNEGDHRRISGREFVLEALEKRAFHVTHRPTVHHTPRTARTEPKEPRLHGNQHTKDTTHKTKGVQQGVHLDFTIDKVDKGVGLDGKHTQIRMAQGVLGVGGFLSKVGADFRSVVRDGQETDIVPSDVLQIAMVGDFVGEGAVGEGFEREDVGGGYVVTFVVLPGKYFVLSQKHRCIVVDAVDVGVGIHGFGVHGDVHSTCSNGLIAEQGELKTRTVVGARGRGEFEGVRGAEEVALNVAQVVGEHRLENGHVEGLDELVARITNVGLAGHTWVLGIVGVGSVDVIAIEAESDIYIKSVSTCLRVWCSKSTLPGASTSAAAVSIR